MPHQQTPYPVAYTLNTSKEPTGPPFDTRSIPLADTERVIQQYSHDDVKSNVREPDAVVAPARGPGNGNGGEELVRGGEGAVCALRRRGRVHQLTGRGAQKIGEVRPAGLAERRIETAEFVGGAGDGAAVHPRGRHAVDEVGQRADAVHEDPEPGQRLRGLHDAIEGEDEREHEGGDVAGGCGIGEGGNEHLRKGAGEDEELHAEEEDEALALGGLDAVDAVVVGGVD